MRKLRYTLEIIRPILMFVNGWSLNRIHELLCWCYCTCPGQVQLQKVGVTEVDPNVGGFHRRSQAYQHNSPRTSELPLEVPPTAPKHWKLECANFSSPSTPSHQHNYHGYLSQEAFEAGPGAACIR